MTRRFVLWTILALIALLASATSAAGVDDTKSSLYYEMPERVVVVSTVVGWHEDFEQLLREVGLIDENNDWIGGEAHLVQLGNMLGRGPQFLSGVELLMKLEKQAEQAGGKVHALHARTENMTLRGDLSRFRRPPEPPHYVRCAGPNAEAKLEEYIQKRVERYEKQMRAARKPEKMISPPRFRKHVESQVEIGAAELVEKVAPGTELGDWLRSRPALVRIGDYIFSFSGVHEKYADMTLEEIDDDARANLKNGVIFHPPLVNRESPIWWSGLAVTRSLDKSRRADWLLWKRNARGMVIGLSADPYYPAIEGRVIHINSRFSYSDEYPPVAVQIVDGGDRLFYLDGDDDPKRIPPPRDKDTEEPVVPPSIHQRERPEIPPFDQDSGG